MSRFAAMALTLVLAGAGSLGDAQIVKVGSTYRLRAKYRKGQVLKYDLCVEPG
jgi:hypothetical protein